MTDRSIHPLTSSIRATARDEIRRAWEVAVAAGALPALPDDSPPVAIEVERPANPDHGDLATNLAMKLARPYRMAPLAIATELAAALEHEAAGDPAATVVRGLVLERRRELGGDGQRRHPVRTGQLHREIGREIAMVRFAGRSTSIATGGLSSGRAGSAPAATATSHARRISSLAVARIDDVRGWIERSVTRECILAPPSAAPPGPWYQSVPGPRLQRAGDCVLVHFAMDLCGQVHPDEFY